MSATPFKTMLEAVQAAYLDCWDRGVPDPRLCRLYAQALREAMGEEGFREWQIDNELKGALK